MGGKGSSGGSQPLSFIKGSGGGGGGGKYSGGKMNVGVWSPGGGKVPSYNKSGAQGPRGESRGSDNGGQSGLSFISPSRKSSGSGANTAKRAAGTAAGALLGNFLLGPVGGAYGAQKGYESSKEGWMGDVMNSRDNEEARDRMESAGISRKDTALASKHGIANSYSSSLLEEGEDYDSVTGEYF